MKKILIVLVSVLTLTSCTQKIGFVNTEKLIQDYKGTKKAEADLKEKSTKVQAEIVKMENAFKAKLDKMSPRVQQQKAQKLQEEYAYINQQKQQAQYALQGESQKKLEEVSKEVNNFVKKYAKENGYKFVLGTVEVNGSVMYGDEKADITYEVLKQLNNAYIEPTEEVKTETKEEVKTETKK